MPSSSTWSDLDPERITAREEHHRRNSPPPSDARKSIDPTDLGAIGAHFRLTNKQESWPKSIEITDDEEATQKSNGTPKANSMSLGPSSDPKDSPPGGSTPTTTRARTPIQGGAFLPEGYEMEEFRRRRSIKRPPGQRSLDSPKPTRASSPCTTHDGEAPQQPSRAPTTVSRGYTPSHHSLGTVDGDNRNAGEGPSSPPPWSEYDQKSSKATGSHK